MTFAKPGSSAGETHDQSVPTWVVVLDWKTEDRASRQAALVAAVGMDPMEAAGRAGPAPLAVALAPEVIARSAAAAFRSRGVRCMLVPDRVLGTLPPPLAVKRLTPTDDGEYSVEVWRPRLVQPEDLVPFRAGDIVALVRAGVLAASLGPNTVETSIDYDPFTVMPYVETHVTRTSQTNVRHVIDNWLARDVQGGDTRVARRVRVSGDRFSWDVLGPRSARGLSDNDNADRLCLRLAEQAPAAAIENRFADFLAGSRSLIGAGWRPTLAGGQKRDDAGGFELYSGLMAVYHEARLGARASKQ